MTPDKELEIWWKAYLAALGGCCADSGLNNIDLNKLAGRLADRSLESYKAKRKELLHEG